MRSKHDRGLIRPEGEAKRQSKDLGGGTLAAAFPVESRLPQADEEARGALAVDRQTIARLTAIPRDGEGHAFLGWLLELFRSTAPEMIDDLSDALAAGDMPAARHLAHRLKGAADNVGAAALRDLAEVIERQAASGRVDAGAAAIDPLRRELAAYVAELWRFLGTSRV